MYTGCYTVSGDAGCGGGVWAPEAGAGRGRNRCSVPPILLSVSLHLTTIYDPMHLCHTLTLKTNLKLLSQNNKNFRNNMNFMYNTYSIVLVLVL